MVEISRDENYMNKRTDIDNLSNIYTHLLQPKNLNKTNIKPHKI